MFTESDNSRYNRNILLNNFGLEGQEKLLSSSVLVVGAGGLGSSVSYYLAAVGVGKIGIMDADVVELSNLQRQIIHSTNDIGVKKVKSAHEKLGALNPNIDIVTYDYRLTPDNYREIFSEYDLIIDCVDSFEGKFLINDAAVKSKKPFIHCGVTAFSGQVFTHIPGASCLRCLLPEDISDEELPNSKEIGILGSVAGLLGTIEATEAIKYLTGTGKLLTNRILFVDALQMRFNEIGFEKNKKCPICGKHD